MKKLNLLKTIVDWTWLMSCFSMPLLILYVSLILVDKDPSDIAINISGTEITANDLQSKLILVFISLSFFLPIYCLFLFRKTLRLFQKARIFDIEVIKNFNTIGIILMISALGSGIPAFILKFINRKIGFEIGLNPFVILFSLGLFFMVLSEVFTIAKKQKEENELTV